MNNRVSNFYREAEGGGPVNGNFHQVIALQDSTDLDWLDISLKVPDLPRGWYELSRLPQQYRIEFTRDYWLSKLPYHTRLHSFLPLFFANLEDVGIYVTQQVFDGPYQVHMVYSLQEERGFFSGGPPCDDEDITRLSAQFSECLLPTDYLAFLQIHDGFSKSTDTGLITCSMLRSNYEQLQNFLDKQDPLFTVEGDIVNPKKLLPFYESFGLHCYQCFFGDWYPEQEMGNVYYSGIEHSISDFQSREAWTENLAFPTFLDWILFYLKGVEEI
ncbi:MAG: SMI1/KNR4 family protein [Parachlamydiales bacterium]|nr:SMI1/KNR4 family protein [Parachlamydiales bacterium]